MLSKAQRRSSGRSRILAAMLAECATPQRPWRAWYDKFPELAEFYPAFDLLEVFADFPSEIAALCVQLRTRVKANPRKNHVRAVDSDDVAAIHHFAVFAWMAMVQISLFDSRYYERPSDYAAVWQLLELMGVHPLPEHQPLWLIATWRVVRDPGRFQLDVGWGYLHRALQNEFKRELRDQKRETIGGQRHEHEDLMSVDDPRWDDMPSAVDDPAETVAATDSVVNAIRALRLKVTPEQDALLQFLLDGYEPAEAIRRAGLPGTGWSVFQSLKRKCQRLLKQA
jgi:hypothetical protein